MRYVAIGLALILAAPAFGSAPPPPPAFVAEAGEALAGHREDMAKAARFFADDVVVTENGRPIARGKAAWLAWRAADPGARSGRTLGYSGSWPRPGSDGGGELLVVETFDTVDRSALPPHFLADPRMASRSILYTFGTDHLIHIVAMQRAESFWMIPRQ